MTQTIKQAIQNHIPALSGVVSLSVTKYQDTKLKGDRPRDVVCVCMHLRAYTCDHMVSPVRSRNIF